MTVITSLPAAKAGPEYLLRLIRDHWAIENRLHHVTFLEDRCRVPAGARALRNLAITLIRRAGLAIPGPRENFREDRYAAIALVTGGVL